MGWGVSLLPPGPLLRIPLRVSITERDGRCPSLCPALLLRPPGMPKSQRRERCQAGGCGGFDNGGNPRFLEAWHNVAELGGGLEEVGLSGTSISHWGCAHRWGL